MSVCDCDGCSIADVDVPLRIPPPATPTRVQLLADVYEGIAKLNEPHVAGLSLTHEQIQDRAANIVTGILGNYRVEALTCGTS